jgi:hypothetical protein
MSWGSSLARKAVRTWCAGLRDYWVEPRRSQIGYYGIRFLAESVFSTDGFFGFIGVRLEPLPNSSRSVWNHQTASMDGKKETNETVRNQDGAIISRLGKACNFRSRISPSRHQGTLGKSHHVTTIFNLPYFPSQIHKNCIKTRHVYHYSVTICRIPQICCFISVSRFRRFLYSSWFETGGGVSMPGLEPKKSCGTVSNLQTVSRLRTLSVG